MRFLSAIPSISAIYFLMKKKGVKMITVLLCVVFTLGSIILTVCTNAVMEWFIPSDSQLRMIIGTTLEELSKLFVLCWYAKECNGGKQELLPAMLIGLLFALFEDLFRNYETTEYLVAVLFTSFFHAFTLLSFVWIEQHYKHSKTGKLLGIFVACLLHVSFNMLSGSTVAILHRAKPFLAFLSLEVYHAAYKELPAPKQN